MKKCIIQGVVAAAVLSLGSLAYGQTSNAIPSEETFEGMTPGDSILVPNNANGWYGDTNTTIAIATNISYTYTNSLYPANSATHTKVLQFSDGSLTNEFQTYDTATNNMIVDFMIKPVPYDGEPSSNLVIGSQTALYLDTNGVHVWYGTDNSGNSGAWMTFTNAALGTADWARVTIAFDYTGDAVDNGPGNSFFKININGLPLTPVNGYGPSGGAGYYNGVGDFLYTASQTKQVHAFALSGSGLLDDFVITTNAVTNFFAPVSGTFELTGSAGTHGTVSPTSTNVTAGNSQVFVVTAQSYYRIASLTTNGTSVGVFDNNSTSTNYTWVDVQATGTLAATFMAQVAGNATATPYWWMAQHG